MTPLTPASLLPLKTHARAGHVAGDIYRAPCGRFVRSAQLADKPTCGNCQAVLAKEEAARG